MKTIWKNYSLEERLVQKSSTNKKHHALLLKVIDNIIKMKNKREILVKYILVLNDFDQKTVWMFPF